MSVEFVGVVRKSTGRRDRPAIRVRCVLCNVRYVVRQWPHENKAQGCRSCRSRMAWARRKRNLKRLGVFGMRCES